MRTAWTLTDGPAELPLGLEDLKGHLRVTHNREDGQIEAYLSAATRAAEAYMARGVMEQTLTLRTSCWADEIPLPMAWPLQSVASVKYYEPDAGVLTTLSTSVYGVDTTSVPGRVIRMPHQSWPSVQPDNPWPIEITYVVGAGSADTVDALILQGIRMHAAYLQLDREGMSQDAQAAKASAERFWTLAGCLHHVEVC